MSETVYSNNKSINQEIKNILSLFDSTSKNRMERTIKGKNKTLNKHVIKGSNKIDITDSEARHIFREFIIGSKLNKLGYNFEYDKIVDGKTPDWIDDNEKIMIDSYTFERGGTSDFLVRINDNISDKCNKYKDIINKNNYNFIVSVYIDFLTHYLIEEVREKFEKIWNIFNTNSNLWGIIFFQETHVINSIQKYEYFCYCRDDKYKKLPYGFIATENITFIHNEYMNYYPKISMYLEKLEKSVCTFKYYWNNLKTVIKQNPQELLNQANDKSINLNSCILSGVKNHIYPLTDDNGEVNNVLTNYNEFKNHSKINENALIKIIDDLEKSINIIKNIAITDDTELVIEEIDISINLLYKFINYISSNVADKEYLCIF